MEPRNGDGPVISLGVYGALKWLLIWLLANAFAFYILMQALVGQRTHQPLSQFMTTTPKKPIDFQALANVMGKSHENKISEPLGDVELKWVTKAKRSHEQMVQFMLGVDPGKVFIKKHRADPPNVVTDKSDSFVLNNKRLCGNQSRLTFLFCIFSKPQNFKQRLDLRETWAQPSLFAKLPSQTAFFIGTAPDPETQRLLEAEQGRFGDLIQGHFIDSPPNNSYKAISALKWASLYCKNAKYFVKVEDIFYVNVFQLARIVTSGRLEKEKNFILGRIYHESMPILRKSTSFYNVANTTFPGQRVYPTYASGVLYMTNNNLSKTIYDVSLATPFFHVEDVYVTGALAGQVHDLVYIAITDTYRPYREGQFVRDLIKRSHKKGLMCVSERMKKLWAWHVRCLHEEERHLISDGKFDQLLKKTENVIDSFLSGQITDG